MIKFQASRKAMVSTQNERPRSCAQYLFIPMPFARSFIGSLENTLCVVENDS